MTYEIILRDEGADKVRLSYNGSLSAASHLAEKLMKRRNFESGRIVEAGGSGLEVWSQICAVAKTDDA